MSDRFTAYIRESLVLALNDAVVEFWTEDQADAIAEALAVSIRNYDLTCAPTPGNPALDAAQRQHAVDLADKDKAYAELARHYEAEKETSRRLRRELERFYR